MKGIAMKVGLVAVMAALSMMMVNGTAFARIKCADMKIEKIGTKTFGTTQVNTMAASLASGTCGNMTVGETRTFYVGDVIGDAGLATALTAMSLGQNVTLFVTDDNAANGTTAEDILVVAP